MHASQFLFSGRSLHVVEYVDIGWNVGGRAGPAAEESGPMTSGVDASTATECGQVRPQKSLVQRRAERMC